MGGVVFLYLMPLLPQGALDKLVNPLVAGCGVAACVVFACVPVRLKRSEAERAHLQSQRGPRTGVQ